MKKINPVFELNDSFVSYYSNQHLPVIMDKSEEEGIPAYMKQFNQVLYSHVKENYPKPIYSELKPHHQPLYGMEPSPIYFSMNPIKEKQSS